MYYHRAFDDLSLGTKNIEIGGILAKILTITLPLPLLLPVVILHRPRLYKVACRKKCIPQFDCTHYLAVFYKVQATTLSSQTLDVVWVERIHLFEGLQKLAPGLWVPHVGSENHCETTKSLKICYLFNIS